MSITGNLRGLTNDIFPDVHKEGGMQVIPANRQISFYLVFLGFSIAACAAASRAIGTRKGEQLT